MTSPRKAGRPPRPPHPAPRPGGISGPEHHAITTARLEAEARGGTPGGGYVTGPGFAVVDPVAALYASITPNAYDGVPLPTLGGGPGVEVIRWACPGCGRLGWLTRHPDDPPCSGLCPHCEPEQADTDAQPPAAPDTSSAARPAAPGRTPALRAAAPTRAHLTAAAGTPPTAQRRAARR